MSDFYEPEMQEPPEGDEFAAFEAAVARASGDRVCRICGLLDSEGGCEHRDNFKRDAIVIRASDITAPMSEALEHAHATVADRLLAAQGAVYVAFDNTGTGLSARELERWFIESPAGQTLGDQAGKAFGAALATAMVAVEADRDLRRRGRWWSR